MSRGTVVWLAVMLVGVSAWVLFMKSQVPVASRIASNTHAAHTDHAAHVDHADHAAHAAAPVPIVTTTFDDVGTLYAVAADDDVVTLTTSHDAGRTFTAPVPVTPEPEALDANGEARPKVAIGRNGEVLVSWTRKGEALYTGDIRFARSTDGGRTFSPPVTINDDELPVGHRFDSLGVAPDGTVVLTWIDKRDLERATTRGEGYAGAAVYMAISDDGGATFLPNTKVRDHSCECCRIAMAFEGDSTPVLFWRHVLPGGVRDHVVVRLTDATSPTEPARVGHENWEIEACPHHGPAFTISPSGRYHFAWFTGAVSTGNAVLYAHSDDAGVSTSAPFQIGSGQLGGHPSLAVTPGRVWLAWKEWRDDNSTVVRVMDSHDDGTTWSAAREVAAAPGSSDRPFLTTRGDDVFLSWTDPRGLRVIAVSPERGS